MLTIAKRYQQLPELFRRERKLEHSELFPFNCLSNKALATTQPALEVQMTVLLIAANAVADTYIVETSKCKASVTLGKASALG